MNEVKNFLLASFSSITPLFASIETPKILTIILPICFFVIGKTVDVLLQIYFRRQEAARRDRNTAALISNQNEEIKQ